MYNYREDVIAMQEATHACPKMNNQNFPPLNPAPQPNFRLGPLSPTERLNFQQHLT
jgi:hypothetical protein